MTSYGTVDSENGLTVSGSSSITAPNNNKLNIDGTGTTVTGDCNITGTLSLNTLSIGSDINYTNLTQTSIICKKSLVLGQTGDTGGSTY